MRNVDIVQTGWQGEPLTIALISDLHIGGVHVPADRVVNIVDAINAQSPDIVLIAGDFVDGHDKAKDRSKAFNDEIEQGILALSNLQAPLGSHATIGNHDDWYDGPRLAKLLQQASVGVLDNAAQSIRHKAASFCLVGLPDAWTGTFDKAVLTSCTEEYVIAFMHSPDSFKYMSADTDLALAGHTHGGQINMPLVGRRVTATELGPKFAYGPGTYNQTKTFVTAGIGTSMLPARFRAPPEIAMITISGQGQLIGSAN